MLGIGCIIGTGIFVLTAAGAQKAGPGLMLSFVIAGVGLRRRRRSAMPRSPSMVPVAGSAYTYTYAMMGEFLAWTVGWALVLEYAIAASAVSVGWSGYFTGTIIGSDIRVSTCPMRCAPGRSRSAARRAACSTCRPSASPCSSPGC